MLKSVVGNGRCIDAPVNVCVVNVLDSVSFLPALLGPLLGCRRQLSSALVVASFVALPRGYREILGRIIVENSRNVIRIQVVVHEGDLQ